MLTNEDNDYKLEFAYAVIGLRSFPYTETQSYVGSTAYAKTVTKTYDANGNKATEAYPSGSGLSLAFSWNDIDNLASISDGTNTIATDAWIGVRRKTETFQSGAKRTNYYTGFREEIESVRHETSGSATILRLDYGYNAVHDRTYERFGASGSPGDGFEYDKLRRLTVAWMGSSTPTSPSGNPYVTKIQYNMDDDGNRTSVVTTPYGQSAQTTSYSTNNLNEYTSVGGVGQSSDANGNLTDNGTYLFAYDYRNHIAQVKLKSTSAVVATYRYDALGRRVEKNVGGAVERHILSIWNDPGVAGDLSHVVSVFDGSDVWKQNFVWSDEVDGIQMLEQKDVLDFDADGNTTEVTRSFYHRNALGSVMEITDMNQAVVVSYRYDPYGKATITRLGVTQTLDPLGNHWTFTGRFLDEETWLLYFRARNYGPVIGRFLQRDPLQYVPGPTLFLYVDASPANSVDAAGLQGGAALLLPPPPVPPPTVVITGINITFGPITYNPNENPWDPLRPLSWPEQRAFVNQCFESWRGPAKACVCKYKWISMANDGRVTMVGETEHEERLGWCPKPIADDKDCEKKCKEFVKSHNDTIKRIEESSKYDAGNRFWNRVREADADLYDVPWNSQRMHMVSAACVRIEAMREGFN